MYDPVDERGVPTSRGVPTAVRIAVVVGILCIFGIGGVTLYYAGYGHVWPATKSLRVPLDGGYRP